MQNLLDAFKGWVASVPERPKSSKMLRFRQQRKLACIVVSMPAADFMTRMTKIAESR
ncbi:hypothetical protein MASR1M12_03020 [Erysipelotrichia bacterium]